MKKYGYTFIELIIVLAILSIFFGIGAVCIPYVNIVSSKITSEMMIYEVQNLLSFAKHYCYYTETKGRIEINKIKGTLSFYGTQEEAHNQNIKTIYLPNDYYFLENYTLGVNLNGVITADTIWIKDSNSKYLKITIPVGIDNINIYE